jgi:hypothetical protein
MSSGPFVHSDEIAVNVTTSNKERYRLIKLLLRAQHAAISTPYRFLLYTVLKTLFCFLETVNALESVNMIRVCV